MSFEIIQRRSGANSPTFAIRMSATTGMKASNPKLIVMLRPSLVDRMSWIDGGKLTTVQIGRGEHDGLLRISPGNTFGWVKSPRFTFEGGSLILSFPPPVWWKPATHKPQPVTFRFVDGILEITTPDWLRQVRLAGGQPVAASTIPATAVVKTEKKPFSMLGGHV